MLVACLASSIHLLVLYPDPSKKKMGLVNIVQHSCASIVLFPDIPVPVVRKQD